MALLGLDISREQAAQRVLVRRRPGEMLAKGRGERGARIDDARIDGKAGRLGRKARLALRKPRLVTGEIHQIGRILAVVDGELRIEPEPRRIFANEPRADGMERAGVGRRRTRRRLGCELALQQPLHPPVQLGRRAAREGRQHDALRVGAFENEMRDAMRERVGLARPGAGDDEERRLIVLDREALRLVEVVEEAGSESGRRAWREGNMGRGWGQAVGRPTVRPASQGKVGIRITPIEVITEAPDRNSSRRCTWATDRPGTACASPDDFIRPSS